MNLDIAKLVQYDWMALHPGELLHARDNRFADGDLGYYTSYTSTTPRVRTLCGVECGRKTVEKYITDRKLCKYCLAAIGIEVSDKASAAD
jgi:hypothetical protein